MIDLKQFCGTDARYYLHEPFSFGGYTYATNGHILVRVARRDDARVGNDKVKEENFLRILEDRAATLPIGGLKLPPDPTPYMLCARCNGDGIIDTDEGDAICDACDAAGHTGVKRSLSISDVIFDAAYIAQIAALPGIMIEERPPTGAKPMMFAFDGGRGALMPMRRAHEVYLGDIGAFLQTDRSAA